MEFKLSVATTVIMTIFFSSLVQANQETLSQLNQIDAAQQQRQNQQQQAKNAQLFAPPDVRLDTSQSDLALPPQEQPCYPIQHISLVDYSADNSHQSSQFQWALKQAIQNLNLTLPHCLGGQGLGILMKQIQNKIIAKGYVTIQYICQRYIFA